jgi:hypothetical protein
VFDSEVRESLGKKSTQVDFRRTRRSPPTYPQGSRAMNGESAKGLAYTIVVRGELDSRFAVLFSGMKMTCHDGTTVVTGTVIDQAQLHGYIERFEDLGLELLSVEQIAQPE